VLCGDAQNAGSGTEGKALEGWWFDRTQEYLARRRGEDFGDYRYATRETFELAPLPCWKHLSPEKRQQLAAALVALSAQAAALRLYLLAFRRPEAAPPGVAAVP